MYVREYDREWETLKFRVSNKLLFGFFHAILMAAGIVRLKV
jgi:hypothetical protein